MFKLTKTMVDTNDDNRVIHKLIFEDDNAIAETVVYNYGTRHVICFSVQSGCHVGCTFCGTGKKFIRDLTSDEMMSQISEALKLFNNSNSDNANLQIMSMSMGEPMDNMTNVCNVIEKLNILAIQNKFPKHEFFLSTVGLNHVDSIQRLISLFKFENFGLQFSLHHFNNVSRKKLLGDYKYLLDISDLRTIANIFKLVTGKRAYFNYIPSGDEHYYEIENLLDIVNGHHLTCSVLCNTNKLICGNIDKVVNFTKKVGDVMLSNSWIEDYDIEISTFNPMGQDTIGGGCGQLLYVQEKLKGRDIHNGYIIR